MSSKDLNGLASLEEFINEEIDSIKVEGRMKSHLYAGTISKVYSEALRFYQQNGHFLSDQIYEWENELKKVTHRAYSAANLTTKAGPETIFNERETESGASYAMLGNIVETVDNEFIVIDVRNSFQTGQTLELLPFKGEAKKFVCREIRGLDNEPLSKTNPSTLVKLPWIESAARNNILRAKI